MNHRGRFITLEGIDGAGKSTHMATVRRVLKEAGRPFIETREPGGTPLGEILREVILNHHMQPMTEMLLMFASRQQHISEVIAPALEAGHTIVSDRFVDASFAYQGAGRGLPVDQLQVLEDWVVQHRQPDLTLLFDLPVEVAVQRLQSSTADADRFECEQTSFYNRVRQGYLHRARQHPQRFHILDATEPLTGLGDQIKHLVLHG